MATLEDGQKVTVSGSTGKRYELARKGDVWSCTCPAWTNQSNPPAARSCKHLRAHLGEDHETRRVGAPMPSARPPARRAAPRIVHVSGPTKERHEKALDEAAERFPKARERFERVFRMRLPRHVLYAAAFELGLSPEEREERWAHFGTGLMGIGEWLATDVDSLVLTEGLDERLHYRYRCDPPEFVTLYGGNSDGGHWGLFYDDPKELPTVVVHNYARDSAETYPQQPTLLATLAAHASRERVDSREFPHYRNIRAWLDELVVLEREAYREEGIARPPPRANDLIGGTDPWIPGWSVPDDLRGYANQEQRSAAYRARSPEVGAWIARARAELAAGQPGRALFLGRELHWGDADEFRAECTELLTSAYEALGRGALASIVRVHHLHRDLRSVAVYDVSGAPLPAIVTAAAEHDDEAVGTLLAEGPPTAQIVQAVGYAYTVAVAKKLFDALGEGAEDAASALLASRIETLNSVRRVEAASPPANLLELVGFLIHRPTAVTRAVLSAALASKDDALVTDVLSCVDVTARDPFGATALHQAARLAHPFAVRFLLGKSADPRAADVHGKVPYDHAREGWHDKPKEAGEIFEMLDAVGGGPPKAPVTATHADGWEIGAAVVHTKFGEGKITAVSGAGDDTKLTALFGAESKTLLAKFLRRAT